MRYRLLTLALIVVPLYGQSMPPLPVLPFDTLDSSIRDQIRDVYDAARKSPEDAGANGRLGMILFAYEQYEFARPCFERARAFSPNEMRWAYFLGRIFETLRKYDEGARAMREALHLDPGYLPAELKLGEYLFESGNPEESRNVFEAVLARHPEAAAAHYGLGRILAARRESDPALVHLQKACELFPEFGAAHYAIALVYRDRGDRAKAQEHMALYQRDKLGWPPAGDSLLAEIESLKTAANSHVRRGIELAESGQLAAAADEHEQALKVDPKLVQAHIHLIILYGRLGKPDRAEEHYRAALALNPNLVEIHYNYGVMLTEQKEFGEAAEAFRHALVLKPAHPEAHYNLAALLMLSGKLDEAAEHFLAALEVRPDYRMAHFDLGRILAHQGKLQEAIDHFLLTLTPDDDETPRCMYALAAAYARTGKPEIAVKYLRDARQKAATLGQTDLAASMDKDLQILESRISPQRR
jgi:tetratricopeptide (TPR) repeat protein